MINSIKVIIYNTLNRTRITRIEHYVFAREIVLRYLKRVCRRSNAKVEFKISLHDRGFTLLPDKIYIQNVRVSRLCIAYDREENKAINIGIYIYMIFKRQTERVPSRRLSSLLKLNSITIELQFTFRNYRSIIIVKFS